MRNLQVSLLLSCLAALYLILPAAGAQSLSIQNQSAGNYSGYVMVNVSVNASNLYGYQYDLLYNSSVLSVNQSGIAEGAFLKTGGITTLCVPVNTSSAGIIRNIACTRTGPISVSGEGNITTITFILNQSIALPAVSQLGIVNSKLSNINGQPIAHSISNGTVSIYASAGPVCGANGCESGETCSSCPGDCGQCPPPPPPPGPSPGPGPGPGPGPACTNNQTRNCSLAYRGVCSQGTETCVNGQWTGCPASSSELCNRMDDDCDGTADENLTCLCYLGDSRACGSNVGECREGTRYCMGTGTWADICTGDTGPSAELCDGKDNDCDNELDEDCVPPENMTVCQDGMIPDTGCLCGGKAYPPPSGYCYGGVYYETGPPEFPWITIAIIGVILFLVLTIIIIYKEFYRKGKPDITWEDLLNKYKS